MPARPRPAGRAGLALGLVGLLTTAACSSGAGSTPKTSAQPKAVVSTTSGAPTTTATSSPGRLVVADAAFALPRPSARAVLVADRDHLLLLGGLNGSKTTVPEVLRIDPARGVSAAGRLAVAVHDAAGALVAGRPTVFGGGNGAETATVQAVGADGATTEIGKLPIPRSDLAAATIRGRTFLVGGYDGARVRGTVIATTDGTTFQLLGDLPVPVRYAAVTALGAHVIAVGGTTTGSAGGAVRAVQVIDSDTGAVRQIGDLPFPLTDAVAVTLRGQVYVVGGIASGRVSDQVWRLDAGLDAAGPVSLIPVATLPRPTSDAAVAVLGAAAYLVGGESPTISSAVVTLEVR